MAPFWANQSCDPFQPKARPCELGNYVDYAINVTEPSDISKGIDFAAQNRIRLVIRNTGHESVCLLLSPRRILNNRLKVILASPPVPGPWRFGPTTSNQSASWITRALITPVKPSKWVPASKASKPTALRIK